MKNSVAICQVFVLFLVKGPQRTPFTIGFCLPGAHYLVAVALVAELKQLYWLFEQSASVQILDQFQQIV